MLNTAPLHAWIREHRIELVESVRQLVQFETVNPPGRHYRECASFLADRLTELGLDATIHEVPEATASDRGLADAAQFPRYNVLARWHVGADFTLHFNAHYDVVPVGEGWRYSPFSGIEHNERLYGRGAADMKGSIGSILAALGAWRACGQHPPVNLEVSFVADEETGGDLGSRWIVEEGLVQADWVVVGEGAAGDQVGLGHNGVLWLEVMVPGRSAHAAQPHLGVNAFERMADVTQALAAYRDTLKDRAANIDGAGVHPTLNLGGTVRSAPGAKTNIVPDDIRFSVDRRLIPGESLREAETELRTCIAKALPGKKLRPETQRLHAAEAYGLRADHPLANLLRETLADTLDVKPVNHFATGFTDAHYFGNLAGLPTIGYGTGGLNFHSVDEFVPTESLVDTARVYAELIARAG